MTARILFSMHLVLSASICGALAFLCCWLAVVQHLYFTSLAVAIVFAGFAFAWASRLAVLDRSLAAIIAGRAEEVAARSPLVRSALSTSLAALDAKSTNRAASDIEQRQVVDQLQALVDTVPAALFVRGADGHLRPLNRASRRIEVGRDALRDLRPGSRRIVALGAGTRHLAHATQFRAPGHEVELLISVQRVTGELDVVEVEAWRNMTRVLAHEMMNSLTPILSVSESLASHIERAQLPGGDIADAIDAIRRRGAGLLEFVQRYRQSSDLPSPVLKPVKVGELLAETDALMASRFREKGITYRSAVSHPTREIAADAGLLTHALINLLTNAIEAVADVAQPTVEVSVDASGESVIITVRDNGPGIREEDREQVFVPFHTTKPGGSGIGLSLARQIAISHGGRLEVFDSHPGCAFVLTL